MCCLSFFDLWIRTTLLVSSNSSQRILSNWSWMLKYIPINLLVIQFYFSHLEQFRRVKSSIYASLMGLFICDYRLQIIESLKILQIKYLYLGRHSAWTFTFIKHLGFFSHKNILLSILDNISWWQWTCLVWIIADD